MIRPWLVILAVQLAFAQKLPRFEDYPVAERWQGLPASIQLPTRSERMFKTRLTDALDGPPQFAGRFRVAIWGCGSNCEAGAFIDLSTGKVYPPPGAVGRAGWERWMSCLQMTEGNGFEYRVESRLLISRCGFNFDEKDRNHPDVDYYVWQDDGFRLLRRFRPRKQTR